jgi:dihydrofolate synthase/folylpolyglutamate synthase
MQPIENFQDIHRAFAHYIAYRKTGNGTYGLERMRRLMEYLGNPQDSFKTVHIAGTSGKTSTAYYIAGLLRAANIKVGLTVSPFVDEINERVQINLKPLSEKKFARYLTKFLKLVEASKLKPHYFEVLTAFAYWVFASEKVDYAVVEVGIGGLLDPTNVITRHDKVCVITDIGLDHTELLGKTIEEIAAQKAGIIGPYNTVFSYEQDEGIMEVLREVSEQQQGELHEVWELRPSELPRQLALFQRRNWYLALQTFTAIQERDSLAALTAEQLAKTTEIYIPARMEAVGYKDKTIIMDGAHNSQKLEALAASIKKAYPHQPVAVLAGFVHTKQARLRYSLAALLPVASYFIVTQFSIEGVPKQAIDPLKIIDSLEALGFHDWQMAENPKKALRALLRRPEKVLVITGSFYLLNHIRPQVLRKPGPGARIEK